jgi:hypothetical protein
MKLLLPFIGREKEMARLHQWHKLRRHVRENIVPEKTLGIVNWLHCHAAGSPKILREQPTCYR